MEALRRRLLRARHLLRLKGQGVRREVGLSLRVRVVWEGFKGLGLGCWLEGWGWRLRCCEERAWHAKPSSK